MKKEKIVENFINNFFKKLYDLKICTYSNMNMIKESECKLYDFIESNRLNIPRMSFCADDFLEILIDKFGFDRSTINREVAWSPYCSDLWIINIAKLEIPNFYIGIICDNDDVVPLYAIGLIGDKTSPLIKECIDKLMCNHRYKNGSGAIFKTSDTIKCSICGAEFKNKNNLF